MRNAAISLCLSATVCGALAWPAALLEAKPGGAGDAKTVVVASAAGRADAGEAGKYIGPGSCAATSCHGSVKPIAGSRILQDEYSTWIIKDKHSRAYQALTGDIGERMARILKLGAKAEEAPKCLACHALYTTPEQRGRPFEITEGVSCENCHGPAQGWLGQHTARESPEKHLESVTRLRMVDTRDVIVRTGKCLECHLGTREKFVDHEMIAAGHPDLYFELDSFMSVMPPHWNDFDKDPWLGVRSLGVGQAVQLREQLKRVAREAQAGIWPEYAELDCFACHHNLTAAKDSWRQERGYPGRRPGNPPWNLSRYVVFRHVIEEADSPAAQQLKAEIDKLYGLVSSVGSDRGQVATQATTAAKVADRLAQGMNSMKFDQPLTIRLMKSISGDAVAIADQGERSAEQATMALDSLFIAYIKNGKLGNEQLIRAAINALFRNLDDPSAYNGPGFARDMQSLSALLP